MTRDYRTLLNAARAAQKNAYAPYSGVKIGAAILTESGEIVTGCNVENASYGAAICAERAAVVKAVSEGKTEFLAIAVTGNLKGPVWPCGICRQVLAEFAPHIKIVLEENEQDYRVYALPELLPHAFRLDGEAIT